MGRLGLCNGSEAVETSNAVGNGLPPMDALLVLLPAAADVGFHSPPLSEFPCAVEKLCLSALSPSTPGDSGMALMAKLLADPLSTPLPTFAVDPVNAVMDTIGGCDLAPAAWMLKRGKSVTGGGLCRARNQADNVPTLSLGGGRDRVVICEPSNSAEKAPPPEWS
mmetsp:Transcript_113716/g.326826  ORF Transcript_113716/g.326826 Transcript_113716/m.326826 type:complete len:165 (-) Transcript_113716:468-962(-)